MYFSKILDTIDSIKDFESSSNAGDGFIICYYDNKACSFLSYQVYPHVIDSIRSVGNFLKAVSLPISDIDIVCIGCITSLHIPTAFDYVKIEPSAYYSELNNENSVSDESDSKELEKTDSK